MEEHVDPRFKMKLLNSSDIERRLHIKHVKFINNLDVGGVYITSYLKFIKYCLKCRNPPLTRQKIFYQHLKLYNQKILIHFPYLPEDLSSSERQSFYNSRNLLLQISKNQEWRDLNSKRNIRSIVFAVIEADVANPGNNIQNLISKIISQKLYGLQRKLAVVKKLDSFSYVGYFDHNYLQVMSSLNKVPNFKKLKVELHGDRFCHKVPELHFNAYNLLTELEIKTSGKVFALSHLEENHKNLNNLETLSIRVNQLQNPESLNPLDKIVNFTKLRFYNLYLTTMDHKTIEGWLKNLTIPKNTERVRFHFIDTAPWNEPIDHLFAEKELKKHFLEAWSGLTKLKEIHILTEASQIYRKQHVRLSLLMLNAFPAIETLTIILTATDETKNQMQGDVIDYIDMNLALQTFLPRMPTLKYYNFITTALSIESFNKEPSVKIKSLEGLTFTNVRGAKSLYHLYSNIEKKKGFKLVLTNMEVNKKEDLEEVFFALKAMAGTIVGSLDFIIREIEDDVLLDSILDLRKSIKKIYQLQLKFKIPSMRREYLEKIGRTCKNMFTKLEIVTDKYLLNIQENNFMYHLVNISLLSETTTSSDSDF